MQALRSERKALVEALTSGAGPTVMEKRAEAVAEIPATMVRTFGAAKRDLDAVLGEEQRAEFNDPWRTWPIITVDATDMGTDSTTTTSRPGHGKPAAAWTATGFPAVRCRERGTDHVVVAGPPNEAGNVA